MVITCETVCAGQLWYKIALETSRIYFDPVSFPLFDHGENSRMTKYIGLYFFTPILYVLSKKKSKGGRIAWPHTRPPALHTLYKDSMQTH